jgi:hypothetical protein
MGTPVAIGPQGEEAREPTRRFDRVRALSLGATTTPEYRLATLAVRSM